MKDFISIYIIVLKKHLNILPAEITYRYDRNSKRNSPYIDSSMLYLINRRHRKDIFILRNHCYGESLSIKTGCFPI